MNRCTVVGNVGRDAESGAAGTKQVVRFSLGDSAGRDKPTTWWAITLWLDDGDRADVLLDCIRKGTRVRVEGTARLNEYDAKDGTRKTRLELSANPRDVSFCVDARGQAHSYGSPAPTPATPREASFATETPGKPPVEDPLPF